MDKFKKLISLAFLLLLAFQLFGLLRALYSISKGFEPTEQELQSLEVYSIFFLWSLLTIPIVLWARKWGREQFWYWLGTFLFFITPIIVLLIKGRNKKSSNANKLSFFHFQTIINYLFINFVFIYFYTAAPLMGYSPQIGAASGIIIVIIAYLVSRSISRTKKAQRIALK